MTTVELAAGGARAVVRPQSGGVLQTLQVGGRSVLATVPWAGDVVDTSRPARTEEEWVARWRGGWQPCFPNSGPASNGVNPPQGFHGNASQAPWTVSSRDAASVTLTWSDEAGLRARRRWTLHSRGVLLEASAANDGDRARPIVLAEHLILGAALLAGPATLRAAPDAVVEELSYDGSPAGRSVRWSGDGLDVVSAQTTPARVFALRDVSEVSLAGAAGSARVVARGDAVRHLLVWEELGRSAEPPWNGEVFALGLEPTSTPHGAGVGAGHGAFVLEPGATTEWSVSLDIEWRDVRS